MRFFIIAIFFLCFCSNSNDDFPPPVLQPKTEIKRVLASYDSMKISIGNYRKSQKDAGSKKDYSILEKKFVAVIVDSIFPYWYGTAWDFNGTTQTPGKGAIACGYFVSTVLRDAGITLNRIKTGQSASQVIVKEFADKKSTKIFSNQPLDSTLNFVKEKGAGLFIIGLDYHVGFVYYDSQHIWFIHSKWANPKAVVKENAAQSGILYYSKYRIVGKISSNKTLLDKWVN